MSVLLTSMPTFAAFVLAMAYPAPFGQPVEPGSRIDAESEIVDIDQDRARRMTVPVNIDGSGPFTFVIDTGAERTVVSHSLAERLALEAEAPAELVSIAGSSIVNMVYIPTLTMGTRNYSGLISPVLLASHIGADGILGLDGLQNQRILFDFVANEISIEDAAVPREFSRREIIVTARRKSGQLIFTDATIAGVKINVIVDTGAQISIANPALQKRLLRREKETDDENLLIAVTGQTLGIEFGKAKEFRIGRARFADLTVAFADAPAFTRLGMNEVPTLLLGMDVLRKFDRVAIDFLQRKIHFLPPTNAQRHKPAGTTHTRIKS